MLIVSGSQQALDLCARVLIDQEDSVGIENPGYPGTHGVFRAHGARVHTVPVDRDGIVVRRLKPGARVIYTTPSRIEIDKEDKSNYCISEGKNYFLLPF